MMYEIVYGEDTFKLEKEVVTLILYGFKPVGGPFPADDGFCQAMLSENYRELADNYEGPLNNDENEEEE